MQNRKKKKKLKREKQKAKMENDNPTSTTAYIFIIILIVTMKFLFGPFFILLKQKIIHQDEFVMGFYPVIGIRYYF